MSWTRERLKAAVREKIGDHKFIVVSNREPFIHVYGEAGIRCLTPASGMTVALNPVMMASGGTWIASGMGNADRETVDARDHLAVPPDEPFYTLRRVWLTKEEEEAFYYGYANEGLWPLCHIVHVRPTFRTADWEAYRKINERFAEVVVEELESDQGFVFIQDYHFALLPRLIKKRRPDVVVAQFWHIPWPNPETFRVCPQAEELLLGLLGNDILGFHLRYHGMNFLDSVELFLEARIDHERMCVHKEGRETAVRAFPISVDAEAIERLAESEEVRAGAGRIRNDFRFRDRILAVGVERIDYTKGILERFQAVDRLLEMHPEYRGKFVFLQLGPLSRIHIPAYQAYNDALYRTMIETNDKWRDGNWQPIHFQKSHFDLPDVLAHFRAADVCLVNAVHDGMNLVAKEFVASRTDGGGMLVLSHFTGSSRELEDALLVHPYDIDGIAEALHRAIEMPPKEKAARMRKMRNVVRENNVFRWAGKIIESMRRLV
jgi:trehalose-6-phosphate synthase